MSDHHSVYDQSSVHARSHSRLDVDVGAQSESEKTVHGGDQAGATTDAEKGGAPSAPVPPARGGPPHMTNEQKTRLVLSKLIPAGISYQLVFWICALWLFGSLYKSTEKTHRLHVAVADFDGGSVGSSLLSAVVAVNGQKTMPTFSIIPANETSPEDLQHRVFEGKFWGGIYATEGATDRFQTALGSDEAAASYSAAGAFVYTGLEVRYNTVWSGFVLNNLNKVVASATAIFNRQTVAPLVSSGMTYSAAAAAVLVNPLASTYANLTPFAFGTRIVLNTIGFVFPSLFCFFFLMALNTVGAMTGWYRNMSLKRHIKFRSLIGALWTLLASLSIIGWYLCFDEAYNIKAKNFFALWAVEWVYCMITYDLLDIATAFVPPQFIPHIVVFYIVGMSVSAVLFPLDLMNHFLRFQHAFPAYATWSTMITIFGNGAVNTLYYNLPVLAAWLVVTKVGLVFSMKRRVKQHAEVVAVKADDKA
ncbi:hypothetical protein JCM6882_004387 [Rhodosporidiobolus microsporus]